MADDEEQIRALIERWSRAVHAGRYATVCSLITPTTSSCSTCRHPTTACEASSAYGETWPPFFEWQRNGAVFEIVSLDITAGADVAFAHALLRRGTQAELED